MALLGGETVQCFREDPHVVIQESVLVPLEIPHARPMVFETLKCPTGTLVFLLECLQLRPQFIEGDEPFGSHVLQTGTFFDRHCQLVSPRLRFSIRVAPHFLALPLDKLLERLTSGKIAQRRFTAR